VFGLHSTTFMSTNPKSIRPPFFAFPVALATHQWRCPSIVETVSKTLLGEALKASSSKDGSEAHDRRVNLGDVRSQKPLCFQALQHGLSQARTGADSAQATMLPRQRGWRRWRAGG
jgi:hypothetical protein